jgi:hypothetical protein
MLPLISLATSVLPDLISLIAGDKAGTVADKVSKVVSEVTQTDDPTAAKQMLDADPAATAALKQKLTEIALDATKAQNAEADSKRADELATLKASIENTASARSSLQNLVAARSPISYASSVVSVIVTAGFFLIVMVLIFHGIPANNDPVLPLVNIALGVLGTGFATVVNFWLGSSSGSRDKDAAAAGMQQTHAMQTGQMLDAMQKTQQVHADQTAAAFQAIKDAAVSPGAPTPDTTLAVAS